MIKKAKSVSEKLDTVSTGLGFTKNLVRDPFACFVIIVKQVKNILGLAPVATLTAYAISMLTVGMFFVTLIVLPGMFPTLIVAFATILPLITALTPIFATVVTVLSVMSAIITLVFLLAVLASAIINAIKSFIDWSEKHKDNKLKLISGNITKTEYEANERDYRNNFFFSGVIVMLTLVLADVTVDALSFGFSATNGIATILSLFAITFLPTILKSVISVASPVLDVLSGVISLLSVLHGVVNDTVLNKEWRDNFKNSDSKLLFLLKPSLKDANAKVKFAKNLLNIFNGAVAVTWGVIGIVLLFAFPQSILLTLTIGSIVCALLFVASKLAIVGIGLVTKAKKLQDSEPKEIKVDMPALASNEKSDCRATTGNFTTTREVSTDELNGFEKTLRAIGSLFPCIPSISARKDNDDDTFHTDRKIEKFI